MARLTQSPVKAPRPRRSARTSAAQPTRVTGLFPNGAQTLQFRVAQPSPQLPAEPVQAQQPENSQANDSPFKRRTRRTAAPITAAPVASATLVAQPTQKQVPDSGRDNAESLRSESKAPPVRGATNSVAFAISDPEPSTHPTSQPSRTERLPHSPMSHDHLPGPHASIPDIPVTALTDDFESFNINDISDSDDGEVGAGASGGSGAPELSQSSSHTPPPIQNVRQPVHPPASPRAGFRQPTRQRSTETLPPYRRKQMANDVHHFVQQDPRDSNIRVCTLCLHEKKSSPYHHIATFRKSTATGSIRRHLYENHLADWVQICDNLKIPITAHLAVPLVEEFRLAQDSTYVKEANPDELRREFSKEGFIEALLQWIISDDQSLRVIDNKHLRGIFLMLRSELRDSDIPSRSTLKRRVEQVFEDYLKKLEQDMSQALGKISYTMDMWTDPNMSPFMAVTAHWMEGETMKTASTEFVALRLRSELIGFVNVPERHTGEHLAEAFLSVIDRLRITYKIGWITLDNASPNDTFAAAMQRELSRRRIAFNFAHRRIRCFPHIVNLACQAVLSAMTAIDYVKRGAPDYVPPATNNSEAVEPGIIEAMQRDPIATLRSLIRAIRASSLRRHAFSSTVKALDMKVLQLLRDVETRWSSTFLMIDRALVLRDAIDQFLLSDEFTDLRKYTIQCHEWRALELFRKILKVPNAFQHIMAKEKNPTIPSALPAFERMRQTWEQMQSDLPETEALIQPGLDKLAEYRHYADINPTYIIATILNPRLKLQWFEENVPHMTARAKMIVLAELKSYKTTGSAAGTKPNQTPGTNGPFIGSSSGASDEDPEDILGMHIAVGPTVQNLESELDVYLQEAREPSEDLLRYWERKRLVYPTIFQLAMDILPIQASAVPCERAFSSSKVTMSARRNRITPGLMEALQVLKFSIKHGNRLDFTAHLAADKQWAELEEEMLVDLLTPEDITSFRESLA